MPGFEPMSLDCRSTALTNWATQASNIPFSTRRSCYIAFRHSTILQFLWYSWNVTVYFIRTQVSLSDWILSRWVTLQTISTLKSWKAINNFQIIKNLLLPRRVAKISNSTTYLLKMIKKNKYKSSNFFHTFFRESILHEERKENLISHYISNEC